MNHPIHDRVYPIMHIKTISYPVLMQLYNASLNLFQKYLCINGGRPNFGDECYSSPGEVHSGRSPRASVKVGRPYRHALLDVPREPSVCRRSAHVIRGRAAGEPWRHRTRWQDTLGWVTPVMFLHLTDWHMVCHQRVHKTIETIKCSQI